MDDPGDSRGSKKYKFTLFPIITRPLAKTQTNGESPERTSHSLLQSIAAHFRRRDLSPSKEKLRIDHYYQIYATVCEPLICYRNPPLLRSASDYILSDENNTCSQQHLRFMNNLFLCVAIGAQLCGQLVAAQEFYDHVSERSRAEWDLFFYENACTFMSIVIYLTQLPNTPTDKIGNNLAVIMTLAGNIHDPQYQHDLNNMLCFAYSMRVRLRNFNGNIGNIEIEQLRTRCIYTELVLPIAFAENVLARSEQEYVEQAKNALHALLNLLSSDFVRMVKSNNIHWHKTLSYALLANLYRLLDQTENALKFSRITVQCFTQQMEMQKYCILAWQVRAMRDAAHIHCVYHSLNDIKADLDVLKLIQTRATDNGNILPSAAERLLVELKIYYATTISNLQAQEEVQQSSVITTTATTTTIIEDITTTTSTNCGDSGSATETRTHSFSTSSSGTESDDMDVVVL